MRLLGKCAKVVGRGLESPKAMYSRAHSAVSPPAVIVLFCGQCGEYCVHWAEEHPSWPMPPAKLLPTQLCRLSFIHHNDRDSVLLTEILHSQHL